MHDISIVQEALEQEGLLGWEQLALSRLKHKVAAQHDLGPHARKKPRKERAAEGACIAVSVCVGVCVCVCVCVSMCRLS